MSNGKLVKVVFQPPILIEDKVEVSFHIQSSVKFKPFPFGANSLSDGRLMLDVTAPPGAGLPLANVLISLPQQVRVHLAKTITAFLKVETRLQVSVYFIHVPHKLVRSQK